jgi:hypothetical protein
MEILANRMGFRIEVGSRTRGWFARVTTYAFTGYTQVQLPGLSMIQAGDTVRIKPDFQLEPVLESVRTPTAGIEALIKSAPSGDESALAMMIAMGLKAPSGTLEAIQKDDQARKEAKVKGFLMNLDRVRRDNHYKRAWIVTYRVRYASTLPQDSPFWTLAEGLTAANSGPAFSANPAMAETAGFWARHGKEDLKGSLVAKVTIAFENAQGTLARVEPISSFME